MAKPKHTIDSALRKVKNGWGIGAYGAEDFLRGRMKDAPRVTPMRVPMATTDKKPEWATVIIGKNDTRCLRLAY